LDSYDARREQSVADPRQRRIRRHLALMRRASHRLAPAAAVVIASILATVVTVQADQGVALDTGRVEISERLTRGGVYHLPDIGVRNPGSDESAYTMSGDVLPGQNGRKVPDDWLTFTPQQFTLPAGASQPVSVSLHIASDAHPGDYEGLLRAEIVASGPGTGVGAAAAAHLKFSVKPSNVLQEWQFRLGDFVSAHAPWSYMVPAIIVGLALFQLLRAKFSIRLERRP